MGVFYNQPQPIPIGPQTYQTNIDSSSVRGGAEGYAAGERNRMQKEEILRKRQKEEDIIEAVKSGEGDVHATALNLEEIDPKIAQEYEKNFWANKAAETKFNSDKAQFNLEMTRQGAQALRAGNEKLGLSIFQSVDPSVKSIKATKNPDIVNVTYANPEGGEETAPMSISGLVKAGTSSTVQYQVEANMALAHLRYAEKAGDITLAKLKAKTIQKVRMAQEMAATYGSMDKAVEMAKAKGIDIEFTEGEINTYVLANYGSIMTAALQANAGNPEYIKVWDQYAKGMNIADFLASNNVKQIDSMTKSFIKNLGVKMKGQGSPITAPEKESKSTSISVGGGGKQEKPKLTVTSPSGKTIEIIDSDKSRAWAKENNYKINE